jgi:multimeric flavodoxin WrbA
MGSPNRNSSTGILVENFKRGAEEAGHSVDVIDVCRADIHISWYADYEKKYPDRNTRETISEVNT